MPISTLDEMHELLRQRDLGIDETSDEPFDRTAFAMRALDLVRPLSMTIAVCPGRRLRVETGPDWRRGAGHRWAMLSIPRQASRRAIAKAVAELAGKPGPYAWDALFAPDH